MLSLLDFGFAFEIVDVLVYSFFLYLASGFDSDDPDGLFDVSLVVDGGAGEQVLMTETVRVRYSTAYRWFKRLLLGQPGGVAGDALILRVTFTGPAESEIGELAFGHQQLRSRVAVNGPVSLLGPGAPGGGKARLTDGPTIRIDRFSGDPLRRRGRR